MREVTIGFDAVAALLGRRVDAATAFWNVEGVQLRRRRPRSHVFRLEDYGAPPYPELVLCVTRQTLDEHRATVRATVRALRRGYQEALADPGSAVTSLVDRGAGDRAEVARELDAVSPVFAADGRPPGTLDRRGPAALGRLGGERGPRRPAARRRPRVRLRRSRRRRRARRRRRGAADERGALARHARARHDLVEPGRQRALAHLGLDVGEEAQRADVVHLAADLQRLDERDGVERVGREVDDEDVDAADLVPGLGLGGQQVDLVAGLLERRLDLGPEQQVGHERGDAGHGYWRKVRASSWRTDSGRPQVWTTDARPVRTSRRASSPAMPAWSSRRRALWTAGTAEAWPKRWATRIRQCQSCFE